MKSRFVVSPALCSGCRTCELACSFAHSVNGKPGLSRIYPLEGRFKDLWVPVVCLQCEYPACQKACLVDCITRNPATGAMDLDAEKCIRCQACVAACPFGCSLHDARNNLVAKCDLCKGDPICAHFCPTKALRMVALGQSKVKTA